MMAADLTERIAATRARAERLVPHLQTWPMHFRRRALEMVTIAREHDFASARRTLELGCGNAFASALIADGREQVVATDLYQESVDTHSVDLRKARQLLDGLDLGWCDVAAASGDALPFANGAFDLVFSLFVLEHVPDRAACLEEVRRVLAAGGLAVHAVPGTMWAAAAPFRFPFYLVRRVLARLGPARPHAPSPLAQPSSTESSPLPEIRSEVLEPMTWALFRRRYPAFPLPPPHGSYKSYVEELLAYRPSAWIALFEGHGFDVVGCAPLTMVSPELFLSESAWARWLFRCDQWLARRRWLRMFGQFFVVIARPRVGEVPCR
ncbi:MAG: class I SAM-dependent methyltransferase [Acidobacteriota bacterium]